MAPTTRTFSKSIPTLPTLLLLTLLALWTSTAQAELSREGSVLVDQPMFGEAEQTSDHFSDVMATGDFDCDGIEDFVFGIPHKDVGGVQDAGRILVAYGSSDGPPEPLPMLFQQGPSLGGAPESSDEFGRSLAVGNFDGQGCDDLAIGVPGESVEWGAATYDSAGAVHVLYGWEFASGLSPVGTQMLHRGDAEMLLTPQANDGFGTSLAAGDFNGDGKDDLAIGVVGDTVDGLAWAGTVHVVYGSAAGLDPLGPAVPTNQVIGSKSLDGEPMQEYEEFGLVMAAGDFDGDDHDDLVVAMPWKDIDGRADVGELHLIFGSASGLDPSHSHAWHLGTPGVPGVPVPESQFGMSLAAADFDGDERCDLAVSVPNYEDEGLLSGLVIVLFGSDFGLSPLDPYSMTIPGLWGVEVYGTGFGTALAAADFDRDGRADLAVSAPADLTGGAAGRVYVAEGRADKTFDAGPVLDQGDGVPGQPGGFLGASLAVGDLDGNAQPDLLVGNPSYQQLGGTLGGAAVVFFSQGLFADGFESGDLSAWSSVEQ